MLEKEHFVVDVAKDTGAAREMLAHNSYDVMTLDPLLSDQDGVSFIRELRRKPATRYLPSVECRQVFALWRDRGDFSHPARGEIPRLG